MAIYLRSLFMLVHYGFTEVETLASIFILEVKIFYPNRDVI